MNNAGAFRILADLYDEFEMAVLEAAFKRKEAKDELSAVYFEGRVDALRLASGMVFDILKKVGLFDDEVENGFGLRTAYTKLALDAYLHSMGSALKW